MLESKRKSTIIFLFVLALLGMFNSCEQKKKAGSKETNRETVNKPELPEKGKVYSRSSINGSYGLFIPDSIEENEKLPVILFLDPHGDGTFPLKKYKRLAEKNRFILIGSNESKNGMNFDQVTQVVSKLLKECTYNLPCDPNRITLAGFSGGAKAALFGGNAVLGFNGIIYCGAAFPPVSIDVKVPVLGITGKKDMNYTEVRNFNSSLDALVIPHHLIEWNGKHEWPDTVAFQQAFYWMLLNAMRNKTSISDSTIIDEFENEIDVRLKRSQNPLDKELILQEAIGMLNQLRQVTPYQKKLILLKESTDYKTAKIKQQKILQKEDAMKQIFGNAFLDKDFLWWNKEINLLNTDKNNASNQRILGYISLLAWSYSSRAVSENNSTLAKRALDLYKLADPENPEHEFLNACLSAKNGNADSSVYFLKKAIELGLKDVGKIENEKALINLHSRNDYNELINSLR